MATFNLKKGYDLNLKGKPQKELISISTPNLDSVSFNNSMLFLLW